MAEKVSELRGIGISRTPDSRLPISGESVRKRRERLNAIGEEGDDLPADPELSYYFDVNRNSRPHKLVKSLWGDHYDIQIYGRLGLYCYNFQQGTNFKFVRWEKYTTALTSNINNYITLEAVDPAFPFNPFSFQTLLSDSGPKVGISLRWRTLACRIKCNDAVDDYWIDNAIDDFYKGEMPKWFSDEDLAADNNNYYVVQESELHENEWLHLFAEIAFYSKGGSRLLASPRLEIENVVVRTKEDATEVCEKLKAENAIFYVSYKYNGDHSIHLAGDYKAIIRKTMDGKPGHMRLEVSED